MVIFCVVIVLNIIIVIVVIYVKRSKFLYGIKCMLYVYMVVVIVYRCDLK